MAERGKRKCGNRALDRLSLPSFRQQLAEQKISFRPELSLPIVMRPNQPIEVIYWDHDPKNYLVQHIQEPVQTQKFFSNKMAESGIEPKSSESQSDILPLNYSTQSIFI